MPTTIMAMCDFLLCVGLISLVVYCHVKKRASSWSRIGTFEGVPLYEHVYASGKKSWRYIQDGKFQYMNATQVPGVEFHNF